MYSVKDVLECHYMYDGVHDCVTVVHVAQGTHLFTTARINLAYFIIGSACHILVLNLDPECFLIVKGVINIAS